MKFIKVQILLVFISSCIALTACEDPMNKEYRKEVKRRREELKRKYNEALNSDLVQAERFKRETEELRRKMANSAKETLSFIRRLEQENEAADKATAKVPNLTQTPAPIEAKKENDKEETPKGVFNE